ncbi:MAG TPA: V-type ATP synthase subunit F [Xanthobacteraceae bacterium]|nr:V-type ATP synthase subunit F [Xanthobacteraceae bacterium]
MGAAIFIGDELSASGFRLTGIETLVPEPEAVGSAFAEARARGALVIITADLARHIPAPQLEAAMLAEAPTIAVIPDVLFRAIPPDLIRRLRSVLGIET